MTARWQRQGQTSESARSLMTLRQLTGSQDSRSLCQPARGGSESPCRPGSCPKEAYASFLILPNPLNYYFVAQREREHKLASMRASTASILPSLLRSRGSPEPVAAVFSALSSIFRSSWSTSPSPSRSPRCSNTDTLTATDFVKTAPGPPLNVTVIVASPGATALIPPTPRTVATREFEETYEVLGSALMSTILPSANVPKTPIVRPSPGWPNKIEPGSTPMDCGKDAGTTTTRMDACSLLPEASIAAAVRVTGPLTPAGAVTETVKGATVTTCDPP